MKLVQLMFMKNCEEKVMFRRFTRAMIIAMVFVGILGITFAFVPASQGQTRAIDGLKNKLLKTSHITTDEGVDCVVVFSMGEFKGISCNWEKFNKEQG